MRKLFYLLELMAIMLLTIVNVYSQSFSISEINSSKFPTITTSFVALDQDGNSYKNLQASDFSIFEGTKNLSSTAFVECQDTTIDPAVSVELVIDKSNSMNSPDGAPISVWVKEGAITFLNTLKFVTGTQVEIITFSQTARVLHPFSSNKTSLINSINSLEFAGGTNYNPPFLDENVGAISRLKNLTPSNIRRIIVFLTDGDPDATNPTQYNEIIQEALTANVQVYAITLKMPMNNDLKAISAQTGGKSYSVNTKDELNNIYNMFAIDIQTKKLCALTWTAPYGCAEADRYRDVKIIFNKPSQTKEVRSNYKAPVNSITKVETNVTIQYFGDPEVDAFQEKVIEITPDNSDFKASGYTISPNAYFTIVDWDVSGALGPPPFTIKKGETRKIKIRFTQSVTKAYRKSTFILEGEPCAPEITLVGGVSQVQIINPNGGEIFSTCDEIDIQWAGVTETTPVSLYYRTSDAGPWIPIASNVTGLSYKWKPNNINSNTIRVRAFIAAKSEYMWLHSAGGASEDEVTGLALHPKQNYFYIGGYFLDNAVFGPYSIKAKRKKDAFIALYGDDGIPLWVNRAGSTEDDVANSICTDSNGNAYIVGYCYQGADFGTMNPLIELSGKQYAYVAKYNFEGDLTSVKVLGATAIYISFTAVATKVKYQDGKIYVQGTYANDIVIGNLSLPKNMTKFQATYDTTSLDLRDLKTGWFDLTNTTSKTATDDQNNIFTTGSYTNSKTFGSYTINSAGGKDVFVNKFGGTPGSNDMSDETFKIQSLRLSFKEATSNIGTCRVNQTQSKVFQGFICNNGELPVHITNTVLSNSSEFFINSNLIDIVIMPDSCIPVELGFSPKHTGLISSVFTVEGECMTPISCTVTGYGICVAESIDSVYMGQVSIGKYNDSAIVCVFKNLNPFDIDINPVLDDETHFKILDAPGIKNVMAGDCYTVNLRFEPELEGTLSAIIDYQLSTDCDNVKTKVEGVGVNAAISILPIEWKLRRKLTENDSVLKIFNNSGFAAKIEQIYFENSAQAALDKFTLTVPDLTNELEPGETLEVPISFIPSDEAARTTKVFVKILGKDTPFATSLSGEGFVPKIQYSWLCPEPIKPGETASGVLEITSTDTKSGLFIHEIKFGDNTGQYLLPSNTTNISLGIGETQQFYITFKPDSPGSKPETIIITSDAVAGPNKLPKIDATQNINCEAIGLAYTKSVDFSNNLICSELTLPIDITNSSSESELILQSYVINGADTDAFNLDFTPNTVVPAKKNHLLNITFSPTEKRTYSATLIINTSYDEQLTISLLGSGDRLYYYSDQSVIKAEPDESIEFRILANVPDLYQASVTELEFEVKYHEAMISYINNSVYSPLNDWTWETPVVSNGYLKFKGAGILNAPFKGHIMTVKYQSYLPDTLTSFIYLKPIIAECPTEDSLCTKVNTVNVCIDEGRMVQYSGLHTQVQQLMPNPAGDKANLTFTMGINARAEVTIVNSFGETVETILNEKLKSGTHSIEIDLSKYNSGVYFVRVRAGQFKDIKKLIIAK